MYSIPIDVDYNKNRQDFSYDQESEYREFNDNTSEVITIQILNKIKYIESKVFELVYAKDENDNYINVDFKKILDIDKTLQDGDVSKGQVFYKAFLKNKATLMEDPNFFMYSILRQLIDNEKDSNIIDNNFFIEKKSEILELLTSNIQDKLLNKEDLEESLIIPEKDYQWNIVNLNTRNYWTQDIDLIKYRLNLEYIKDQILEYFRINILKLVDLNNIIELHKTEKFYDFYNSFKLFLISKNRAYKKFIQIKLTEDIVLEMIVQYTTIKIQ